MQVDSRELHDGHTQRAKELLESRAIGRRMRAHNCATPGCGGPRAGRCPNCTWLYLEAPCVALALGVDERTAVVARSCRHPTLALSAGGSPPSRGCFWGFRSRLEYIGAQVAAGLVDVVVHGAPRAFGVPGPDGVEHRTMVLDGVAADVAHLRGLASGWDQQPAQWLQECGDERVVCGIEHGLMEREVCGDEGVDVAVVGRGGHRVEMSLEMFKIVGGPAGRGQFRRAGLDDAASLDEPLGH